jgi:regulatory protein
MRITALQSQINNPERINIFVDGQFLLGVHAMLVLQMGLATDQELTPEQLEQLRYEEALQLAVDRALNFLSFRPRSREEVRRYLRRKQTPPELIQAALEKLHHLDLVNDQDFAEFWIENRNQFSPRGAQVLKQELRMKGIQREVVDELVSDEQDEELAMQAARKKAASLARQPAIDYATFYRRLGSFLQRRGFNYEITNRTVKTFWQELGPQGETDDQETNY